jgi:RNA polymerase sigma factor (sigma-70 family)
VYVDDYFAVMYDQYFDDVYRYIYVKTGDKWDAEDIVSETFRKAYEKFVFLQEETNHKAWLMTIARNTIIDYYRKKKGVLVGENMELYLTPVPFVDPLEESDELECLRKSLHHLPKEEMEIVNLRYFTDLKFKEIAAMLKKLDDSIRVKSNRITKKIGLLIKKCLGEAQ